MAVYPDLTPFKKGVYRLKIIRTLLRFKKWSNHAPANHRSRYFLLRAEWSRVSGQEKKVRYYYKNAIALADHSEHFGQSALPNELYGQYWLTQNEADVALIYLKRAHHLYGLWGAQAKVKDMEKTFPQLRGHPTPLPIQDPAKSAISINETNEMLDLSAVIKASQAISSEIIIDRLLDRLMHIVMENAGAEKGFLILPSDVQHQAGLIITACFGPASLQLEAFKTRSIEDAQVLSASMVQYVVRTGDLVISADIETQGRFGHDPYITRHHPKSVLCIPIRYHGRVTGALYLENTLVKDAFTPERVKVIQLLASQAAISIHNAQLYTKFRSLYENSIEGLFQVNVRGGMITANPAAAKMLGFATPDDLIHEVPDITQFFVNSREFFALLVKLRKQGRVVAFEAQLLRRDQKKIWVSLSLTAVRDGNERLSYFEGAIVDVSAKVEKEKVLRAQKALEATNALKSRFIATMSHEIRTPLNSVIGLAALAEDLEMSPKLREYLAMIRTAGQTLLGIINNILDYSKMEARRLEFETSDFELMPVITGSIDLFAAQAKTKGIAIIHHVAATVPWGLRGDPIRLGQVLTNLIGNALKFTAQGRIVIRVALIESTAKQIVLEFSVTDTGIGIPQNHLTKVFEVFSQVDASTSRKYGGTGLGLTICKELVRIMEGQIRLESEPGRGTKVIFTACFQPISQEESTKVHNRLPSDADFSRLAGSHILLVEDNVLNQKVAFEILRSHGMTVSVANSGKAAVAAVAHTTIAAVLMDIQMPEMDGYQATQRIRQMPRNHSLPIIAMSAGVFKGDRASCLKGVENAAPILS